MEAIGEKNNNPKDINDVRIGMQSIVGKVIGYCNLLLTEKQLRTVRFTAVGGAIGKLINVVENLRIFHSGLYQSNVLSTVSYQAVDKQGKVINERLHPKMEVHLSFDEPAEKHEGFQTKLNEDERKALHDFMNARREQRQLEGPRGEQRGGRGRGRGEFRGGRGGQFRGGRGQFRGGRGQFRGGRGGQFRGGDREEQEFRGERSEFRGERSEFRGEREEFRGDREEFRGGRGQFRGGRGRGAPFRGGRGAPFRGGRGAPFRGERGARRF
jgi:hypothetical protein